MPHEFINWADFQNKLCCCLGGDVTPGPGAGDGGGSGSACVGLDSQPDAEITHFSGSTGCTTDTVGTYTYVDGDFESGENVGDFAASSFVKLTVSLSVSVDDCSCSSPPSAMMEQLDFVSVTGSIAEFASVNWTATWDYLTHNWVFSSSIGGGTCETETFGVTFAGFEPHSLNVATLWTDPPDTCDITVDNYTIDEVSNDTNYGDACCLYTWTFDAGGGDINYLRVWYCPVAHEWCAMLDFLEPAWGGTDCMGVGGSSAAQVEISTSGGQLNGTFTLDDVTGNCASSIQVVLGSG